MTDPILVFDLKPQIAALRAEFDAAIARVLDRGWFILGEEGRRFEEEFARYLGLPYLLGVANGTDAIQLALRAVGVGAGDAVLIPPSTANPTACAVSAVGARLVFADVERDTGLFDLDAVEAVLARERVKAIIPVHLYGRAQPLDRLIHLADRHGAVVIEDVAQAHGARGEGHLTGTRGAISCFSFYPSKNLGAFGDGGAVATRDPELAERLRMLRNYGQADRYQHVTFGLNSRLDELQAAILAVKLPHLERWNDQRRAWAARYRERLAGLPLVMPPPDAADERSIHHLFVVRVAERDAFREQLRAQGIATEVHYPVPIHRQPAYAALGQAEGSFPVAEARAKQIVSLPLYAELTEAQFERVVAAVRAVLDSAPHPEDPQR